MQDFFEDLYDEQSDEEPSFSLYDFKKWLSKQKKPKEAKISESVEQAKKDKLKDKFKNKIKSKLKKDF